MSSSAVTAQKTEATVPPPQVVDVSAVIKDAALAHGVNVAHFIAVANCEDPGLVVDQQSNYIRKDGTREPSYGIFMIDREYHPEIPLASSTDPVWAANWAAEQWATGDPQNEWACYKKEAANNWQ